ncbi:MAG: hypothetical protein EA383_03890 [Spirochaetaceae bacterium]|nr:MAG: hypothetical protein EA383_03890 [Spirochaetaceae bacterium]
MQKSLISFVLAVLVVGTVAAEPSTGTRIWDGTRIGIAAYTATGAVVYSGSTLFAYPSLDSVGTSALALGAYTLPNSMMLLGLYQGNADRVRFWRRAAAITQTGMAAFVAGIGVYGLAVHTDGDLGSLVGPLFILASVPLFSIASLHYTPYYMER